MAPSQTLQRLGRSCTFNSILFPFRDLFECTWWPEAVHGWPGQDHPTVRRALGDPGASDGRRCPEAQDPEENPYKSKYVARELLELSVKDLEQVLASEERPEQRQRGSDVLARSTLQWISMA